MAVTHRSAVKDIMTAFYTVLNTTGITGICTGGVYNNVPQNTPFPYLEIANPTEIRWDTMGCPGKDATVQVHVVSQYPGDSQALTILSKAVELLHYSTASVNSHAVAAIQYENLATYSELVNGILTRHAVGTFRVRVTQST